eukprot:TRINITY_DN1740_c0_g1_i1.p1 TRINITY_DN1740_c0_g1~~TRINITY_DN1740_c0_g1_i1.p1  ORF type:complete len:224 (+),score=80.41 TRINITY_DN1740_c0_g1_i1:266-937(+)
MSLEPPTEWHVATDEEFDSFLRDVDGSDGWNQCYKSADVNVWWQKSDVSAINEIKVQAIWKHIDMDQLYDVLHDSEYRRIWDKNALENDLIEQLDKNNDIGYYAAKCPPGITNRDFVNIRSWRTRDTEYIIMNHSVQHPSRPPKKGYVRANSIKTGYVLRRIPEGGVNIIYLTSTDPRGSIPSMLLNTVTQKLAPKILGRMEQACKEYGKWKSENNPDSKPWR